MTILQLWSRFRHNPQFCLSLFCEVSIGLLGYLVDNSVIEEHAWDEELCKIWEQNMKISHPILRNPISTTSQIMYCIDTHVLCKWH